jgi:alpha-L-fucosidase
MAGALSAPKLSATASCDPGKPLLEMAPRFGDDRDWWFERRFGMFVHWGLYSINGWHEQEQWRRKVPRSEYGKLKDRWNPVKFDPEAWLDHAEAAGMGYICLTTKHHDGFCLFESKETDFHSVNSPYGKDVVGKLAQACQKRGFPLCLYYSIVDWHHPNYPNQGRHHELAVQPGDAPDWEKYLEFVRRQIRELCTNYGEIHGIWWDMNVPEHQDASINGMIRQLQPKAVINDRGFDAGDFGTPERDYVKDGELLPCFSKRTEACQSVGEQSWGFRMNEDYYSDRHLIRSISKYRTRDANYLLNVGPAADGTIPSQQTEILHRIGAWYQKIAPSLATPCPGIVGIPGVFVTRDRNTLYVHLVSELTEDAVELRPLTELPRKATLLNDGRPLICTNEIVPANHAEGKGWLRVRNLPVNQMSNTVMVLKLEFDSLSDCATDAEKADPGAINRR